MISGTLPNNTVWWISTDGKKVWIESDQLENQKFIDKGYNIIKDVIFNHKIRKQIGELTGSRLERRLYKDSWIITLDAFLDVYPDLIPEIENKTIEEKRKKRQTKSKAEHKKSKVSPQKEIENEKIEKKDIGRYKGKKKEDLGDMLGKEGERENKDEKIIEKSYFDITYPYVEWIKEEINKDPNGELKILSDDMKEKMGCEYQNMHVMRIYFGLKKILPGIGIDVELGKSKGKSALIMKRIEKAVT